MFKFLIFLKKCIIYFLLIYNSFVFWIWHLAKCLWCSGFMGVSHVFLKWTVRTPACRFVCGPSICLLMATPSSLKSNSSVWNTLLSSPGCVSDYLINSDTGLLSTKASYGDQNCLGSRRAALSLSHSFREKYWGGQSITDKIPPVGFLLQFVRVVKVCRHPASRSELYISASESSKSQGIFVSQWCGVEHQHRVRIKTIITKRRRIHKS